MTENWNATDTELTRRFYDGLKKGIITIRRIR